MSERFSRTERLFGTAAMEKLAASRVAVFGLGGVGGYAAEALARSGVGRLDLIDNDTVSVTNLNRQILATEQTLGMAKTDAAEKRILSINPNCRVRKFQVFFLPETGRFFDFSQYDYVVDAVDTVTAKLALAEAAAEAGTPIISAMGTGNKVDPTAFEVADISKTSVCPLARVLRKELRKRGIRHLKVVYSRETPLRPLLPEQTEEDVCAGSPKACACPDAAEKRGAARRDVPASNAFVPGVAGLILAGEVVKDLIGWSEEATEDCREDEETTD